MSQKFDIDENRAGVLNVSGDLEVTCMWFVCGRTARLRETALNYLDAGAEHPSYALAIATVP